MTDPERTKSSSSQRSASSMTWLETTMRRGVRRERPEVLPELHRSGGSTPTVGSSRKSTAGLWTSAQASERRRRWPPERSMAVACGPVGQLHVASASMTAPLSRTP